MEDSKYKYHQLRLYYIDTILKYLTTDEKHKIVTKLNNKKIFNYQCLYFYRSKVENILPYKKSKKEFPYSLLINIVVKASKYRDDVYTGILIDKRNGSNIHGVNTDTD